MHFGYITTSAAKRIRTSYIRYSMQFERNESFGHSSYSVRKYYSRTEKHAEYFSGSIGLQRESTPGRLEEIVIKPPILIRENRPERIEQKKPLALLPLGNYKAYY